MGRVMDWNLYRRQGLHGIAWLRGWGRKTLADPRWGTTGTISAGVHLVVIGVLVHTWLFWAKPMPPVGSKEGTQKVMLYAPGRSAVAQEAPKRAAPKLKRAPKKVLLVNPATVEDAVKMPAPVAPHPDGTTGSDSLGNGSVNIARVQAFPALKPDLSKMSLGSSADVVVDVEIDDTGRVSAARARRGMGHGIDEVVVATVEQWLFYPAIKNGRPVTSQQEIRFHYDRGQGEQACGWDCFQLEGR
jgi:periplasmic protein TonB